MAESIFLFSAVIHLMSSGEGCGLRLSELRVLMSLCMDWEKFGLCLVLWPLGMWCLLAVATAELNALTAWFIEGYECDVKSARADSSS